VKRRRQDVNADPRELAEQVRAALVDAALNAWEDAGVRGLCAEGAWEAAVGRMRTLDLSRIVAQQSAVDG
jgi:hypothetical protein